MTQGENQLAGDILGAVRASHLMITERKDSLQAIALPAAGLAVAAIHFSRPGASAS